MTAFPISESTFRADIAAEFARRGKTTMGALIFVQFVCHFPHLYFFFSIIALITIQNFEQQIIKHKKTCQTSTISQNCRWRAKGLVRSCAEADGDR
jgi:hypothetical protein